SWSPAPPCSSGGPCSSPPPSGDLLELGRSLEAEAGEEAGEGLAQSLLASHGLVDELRRDVAVAHRLGAETLLGLLAHRRDPVGATLDALGGHAGNQGAVLRLRDGLEGLDGGQ